MKPSKSYQLKRRRQSTKEKQLLQKLYIKQKGGCYYCGTNRPDWRGWTKHEIIFRSQGGDPLDENNCVMTCAPCHSKEHNIKEV